MAEQLAKTPGKDRLTLTVKPIPNGAAMRLSVDPGVTKTLAELFHQAAANRRGGEESSDEN